MKKIYLIIISIVVLLAAGCNPAANNTHPINSIVPSKIITEPSHTEMSVYPILVNRVLIGYVMNGKIYDYSNLTINGIEFEEMHNIDDDILDNMQGKTVTVIPCKKDTKYYFYSRDKFEYEEMGLMPTYWYSEADCGQELVFEIRNEYKDKYLIGIGSPHNPYPREIIYEEKFIQADIDNDGEKEKVIYEITKEKEYIFKISIFMQKNNNRILISELYATDDFNTGVNFIINIADLNNDGLYEIIVEYRTGVEFNIATYIYNDGTFREATNYYRFH